MSKHYETKQVILMRTDLRNTQGQKVRSGKLMAQAAHASMMWLSKIVRAQLASEDGLEYAEDSRPLASLITNEQRAWTDGSFAKIVLAVGSEDELVSLIAEAKGRGVAAEIVTDAGKTEFGGVATVTCGAIGPADSALIDKITGHLKPL